MIRNLGLVVFALLQGIPETMATEFATYICIEERSAGWEPREGKVDVIGQFQPDASPMIIKAFPSKISDNKVVTLGKIEVTEEGKTSTFTTTECSEISAYMIRDRAFRVARDVDYYVNSCASILARKSQQNTFGFGSHTFYFTKDPAAGETPVQYREALMVGIRNTYVHLGTCTLQ
ncbi:hypothetical protein [Phyllobacterium sp. SB3]|uniref:hypothetical protein n=1 Tax=Phyllobacterium sp. SB3 TaxID=3156073 RepID=UPI0032AF6690